MQNLQTTTLHSNRHVVLRPMQVWVLPLTCQQQHRLQIASHSNIPISPGQILSRFQDRVMWPALQTIPIPPKSIIINLLRPLYREEVLHQRMAVRKAAPGVIPGLLPWPPSNSWTHQRMLSAPKCKATLWDTPRQPALRQGRLQKLFQQNHWHLVALQHWLAHHQQHQEAQTVTISITSQENIIQQQPISRYHPATWRLQLVP